MELKFKSHFHKLLENIQDKTYNFQFSVCMSAYHADMIQIS